ncbi:alpha/beta hydrolase [Candidatus Enterococcus lemimoniae]|uniref:Alpha/beta hydrolase n=1 Tax=Candidatus Enterococcus lemimoniae TaxID=1834167 RepID=A0ABZ2TA06_9ENTE
MFNNYNRNKQFNFQMNRFLEPYEEDGSVQKEVKEIANQLEDLESWYKIWFALGKKREKDLFYDVASCYYQLAEFYLPEEDPRKQIVYELFKKTFYKSIDRSNLNFIQIPYENTFMPGVIVKKSEHVTQTLIVHGGFDSYLEELIRLMNLFDQLDNYQLILFEGPGQGELIKKKVAMTNEWEKPVGAVLDYCKLSEADLLGMSLGGYLALRASAFEPRIKRVIAFDIMYSMEDAFKEGLVSKDYQTISSLLESGDTNKLNERLLKVARSNKDLTFKLTKGYSISNTNKPSDLLKFISSFSLNGIEDKVQQEVLLMAGTKDMYVPVSRLAFLMTKLINAKKIETILYTECSGGEMHCQVGNKKEAINDMTNFLLKRK